MNFQIVEKPTDYRCSDRDYRTTFFEVDLVTSIDPTNLGNHFSRVRLQHQYQRSNDYMELWVRGHHTELNDNDIVSAYCQRFRVTDLLYRMIQCGQDSGASNLKYMLKELLDIKQD